ncbi:secreted RxLR effector protein 161-like [Nicotiana sylvestris]|uniref:secreted RxLR effector protein 161-like n=1 Tax=Nicotiana sylvestris TaxID=4096 RepID=UPI00388C33FE
MYRGIIGSLLYLTASPPDIVFSMGLCARFQSIPKESHLKAAKRILRYLKGTQDLVLYYPSGGNFNLIGYADADYVGYLVDRKTYVDQAINGDFGVLTESVPLLSDNTGALNMAKNPVQHKRPNILMRGIIF